MTASKIDSKHPVGIASAGLPDAPEQVDDALRVAGIDPDRLSITYLGKPQGKAAAVYAPWAKRLATGFAFWVALYLLKLNGVQLPIWAHAPVALMVGLLILEGACAALVVASERLVMFMVLPFTLIAIGFYQIWINPGHPELPLLFSFSNMLLLLFLFPMLFVLVELLREDHTLGLLDTTIMVAIFLLLIALLLTYGAQS